MEFNQKQILRNMNEYMLTSPKWEAYGGISSLMFDQLREINSDYKLQRLSISMQVDFANKEWLFEFLDNVENKIYLEVPVMYVIESMSYDVVNYDEPQTIWIKASVYFFTWEIEVIEDDLSVE